MTVQFASDLHLEFPENEMFLRNNPIQPIGDVLILAGDIVPFAIMNRYDDFFKSLSERFEQVYWIPGNHEFYHYDVSHKPFYLNETIKENIHLVNNHTVEFDNERFIFSTLWSDISERNKAEISMRLNDFRLINQRNKRFTADDYNVLHQQSLQFLENELCRITDKKTVVVTHHVPTLENYPAQYAGDALNDAFATELKTLILQTQPKCWIYGHSHRNTPAIKLNNTTLLTNQLGYVKYGENKTYRNNACI